MSNVPDDVIEAKWDAVDKSEWNSQFAVFRAGYNAAISEAASAQATAKHNRIWAEGLLFERDQYKAALAEIVEQESYGSSMENPAAIADRALKKRGSP